MGAMPPASGASVPNPAAASGKMLAGMAMTVITVSDRSSRGERADATGPLMVAALEELGAIVEAVVVADQQAEIAQALRAAIAGGARAVITTGGTGVGPRDVTPEATASVIVQDLPGIPELLRTRDAAANPRVALSRGRAGVTAGPQRTLVINLPGSVGAVTSALQVLPGIIAHACSQIDGGDH